MPPATPPISQRLPLLDGMRGVAAIAVMLFHEAGLYGARGFLSHSFLAVDFFLLLSGFVLARAFEPRLAAGPTTRGFMAIRIRKLYPLMALGTVLGALHALLNGQDGTGVAALLVMSLLYIPHLAGGSEIFPLNGPQWSLMVELLINFTHASGLVRLPKLAILALSGACALLILRAAMRYGTLDLGWQQVGIWVGPVRAGFAYLLGIVMARTVAPALSRAQWLWLVPLVLLPTLMWSMALFPPVPSLFSDWVVIIAGLPLLLLLALRTGAPDFAVPLLDWLGRLSFPLYAVHLPLLSLAALAAKAQPDWPMPIRIGGAVLAIGVAALLAETRLGGKPARRPAVREALA